MEPYPHSGADARRADPRQAEAARLLLARDGVAFVLRPWQAGYLLALADGRDPGPVPLACGLGIGWLQAKLDEAVAELGGR